MENLNEYLEFSMSVLYFISGAVATLIAIVKSLQAGRRAKAIEIMIDAIEDSGDPSIKHSIRVASGGAGKSVMLEIAERVNKKKGEVK